MNRSLIVFVLVMGATTVTAADVSVGGQVRSRWELREKSDAGRDNHTAMRTRLHLRAQHEGGLHAFVQWQDVRIWGEETHTLGDFSGDHLDLHQGYVQFDELAGRPIFA